MLAEFWAGYVSGAAGIIIGNPLDIVKVRAQASLHSASAISDSSLGVRQGLISSRPEKLSTFTSLLRGLPAPVLTYGALNALLFVSYSQALLFSSYIYPGVGRGSTTGSNTGSSHPYWNHFTAGCFAGIATFIVSAPTELIKCRAQTTREHTARGKPISSWAIARSTYVQDGIRGLYHGGTVTVLRDSVGYGFYFLSYEACKDLWDHAASSLGTQGTSSPTTLLAMDSTKVLLCGGIAGMMYPFTHGGFLLTFLRGYFLDFHFPTRRDQDACPSSTIALPNRWCLGHREASLCDRRVSCLCARPRGVLR